VGILVLLVPIAAIIIGYAYLKTLDSHHRSRGATEKQLEARSLYRRKSSRAASSALYGIGCLCPSIYLPLESHWNKEPFPWLKTGILLVLAVVFLLGSFIYSAEATALKKFSEARGPWKK
jgi:hypothetical protein